MSSKNVLIGAVVVLVLIALGYMVYKNGGMTTDTTYTTNTSTEAGSVDNTPPPTPAETPSNPGVVTGALVVPSNTSAVVTGYVAPNGAATTYWYDYGTTNSLGTRSESRSAGAGFVTLATPMFLNNLAANTTYYFRISAQNSFGTVQGSTRSFTTTTNPPPNGSAPTVTTSAANGMDRNSATLTGSVNPHNSPTTFWFEYGTTESFGNATGFGTAGSGTDNLAVAIKVGSLRSQTKYYFRLNAQNSYGTVIGDTQSFTTGGPAATGLPTVNTTAATKVATSTATLNARINPHNSSSTYWFEYSTSPLLTNILGTLSATQTLPGEATTNVSADVTGLSTNTKYYFRAVARNPQGTTAGDIQSFSTKR